MDIHSFLNPVDEQVEDHGEDILQQVADAYSVDPSTEKTYETDEDDVQEAKVTADQALILLRQLRLHEEQQEDGDEVFCQRLNRHERELLARTKKSKKQSSITSYFSRS